MATFAVILPAAGRSTRFGDQHYKKPFALLDGRAVWMHAAEKFTSRADVQQTIVVVSPEDRELFQERFGGNAAFMGVEIVEGGEERADSVAAGLARVRSEIDFVAVHDAARPCIAEEWIDKVFAAAEKTGAAMLAIRVNSTLKRVSADNTIAETVSREGLWEAQTPQVFRRQLLLEAYANRGSQAATDDALLVERLGQRVTVVVGSAMNLKITSKDDLRLASAIMKVLPKPQIFGSAHPFDEGDKWR